jgi:hypothetical protein
MDIKTIDNLLRKRIGKQIEGDGQYYYHLLKDSYDCYFRALKLAKESITDKTLYRSAVGEKNEAFRQILKLLKHFGIEPNNETNIDNEMKGILEDHD